MDEDFKEAFCFRDYYKLKQSERNNRYGGQGTQNYELQRTIGRMYFPTFDGIANCTARACVENMDTYFQLNWMAEQEDIKMAALHLEGEAHDWWFHSLNTFGHAQIVSYDDFTRRVVERFDQRDPEASFRKLTQLRQTGNPEQYFLGFLHVAVMVPDMCDARRVYTLNEGLLEPLCGLVKSHKPSMLQEVMVCARDL